MGVLLAFLGSSVEPGGFIVPPHPSSYNPSTKTHCKSSILWVKLWKIPINPFARSGRFLPAGAWGYLCSCLTLHANIRRDFKAMPEVHPHKTPHSSLPYLAHLESSISNGFQLTSSTFCPSTWKNLLFFVGLKVQNQFSDPLKQEKNKNPLQWSFLRHQQGLAPGFNEFWEYQCGETCSHQSGHSNERSHLLLNNLIYLGTLQQKALLRLFSTFFSFERRMGSDNLGI